MASQLRAFITADQIQNRIAELGNQIDRDYGGKPITMICILKGACYFFSDLSRAVTCPARLDFLGLSSYGRDKTTSGQVKLTKDLDQPIQDADVVVVEDIVDSGITISYLIEALSARKPKSLEIATLLDKPDRRQRPVKVKYVGFEIPDQFVVGYGLDYAEEYRNLRDVCILESVD
jgi:hypoxanthine phosphoribosyltransferase